MRSSSRIAAVALSAIVWIYAGMSVASRPLAAPAITPSLLDVTASCAQALLD
jgi:ABC-type anion transport system duplicated permease subunit